MYNLLAYFFLQEMLKWKLLEKCLIQILSSIIQLSSSTGSGSLIWRLSTVSDGMSKSKSIINHYYPISLLLNYWSYDLLLMKIEKEDLINQSIIIIHTLHYQYIPFSSSTITSKSTRSKSNGLKSNQISFIIHSIIHTLK